MPITPSLRHCSNKYKLAREGEKDKEKDEDFGSFFFVFLSSQVELKEKEFYFKQMEGIMETLIYLLVTQLYFCLLFCFYS